MSRISDARESNYDHRYRGLAHDQRPMAGALLCGGEVPAWSRGRGTG